jgi:hypothetical protein
MVPPNEAGQASLRFRHEKRNIHLSFTLGRLVALPAGRSEREGQERRLPPGR